MLTIAEIICMDGIVIRKIPTTTTRRWRCVDKAQLPTNAKILERKNGIIVYEETKENSLAGYVITFSKGTDATVTFYKKTSGFGKTLEEAFEDYIKKNPILACFVIDF